MTLYFNPRPREEGDYKTSNTYRVCFYFNPRPREEGDRSRRIYERYGRYFNPRPREEGDTNGIGANICGYISIHALVKRATLHL